MKKTILLVALILVAFVNIQAQNSIAMVDKNMSDFEKVEVEDVTARLKADYRRFKKVEKAVVRKLQSEMEYPEMAYEYNLEGTVLVQFSFDGKINDATIIQSVGGGCDEAALEAIQDFPKLYQEMGGEQVDLIKITVPFKFDIK